MNKPIAIIGAGNGGQAFAAYLSLHGREVKIFDVFQETVDQLNKKGGITMEGNSDVEGFGKIRMASTDIKEVMEDTDIVMIVLPTIYHNDMAKRMAPHLKDGQCVMLSPQASLGPIEFQNTLDACGCTADIILACTATLLFACRAVEVGKVVVAGQKKSFGATTYPSCKIDIAASLFREILPQFDFRDDVIRNSLDNINAFVHPAPTILNTGRIESGTPFDYYTDITPAQGRYIDALDQERMAIAEAFGLKIRTLVEEYKVMYRTQGENMYEILSQNQDLLGIKGQTSLNTRYIYEDIPNSLEAVSTLGKLAGVPTPCVDAMAVVGRTLLPGIGNGRTISSLGLEGISKEEFLQICRTGQPVLSH